MCMVSAVTGYGRQTWPQPVYPHVPVHPSTSSQPVKIIEVPKVPTQKEWAEFLELVEKAKKFDELANQPDCEDPEKAAWMERIEERLAALEAAGDGQVAHECSVVVNFSGIPAEIASAIADSVARSLKTHPTA